MRETLFLNELAYPAGFVGSQAENENAIIQRINLEGHGRSVEGIRYVDLRTCFKHFDRFKSKFVGAVCSSIEGAIDAADDGDPYTWQERVGNKCVNHTIKAFVVLTSSEVGSRNSFIAQSLFPFLFTQITTTELTPCKIVSAKPIYLLCMLSNEIDIPPSVQRDIDFASSVGIRVIAPLRTVGIVGDRPLSIEQMNVRQSSLGMFSINEEKKILTVEKSGLYGLLDDTGAIKGSNEKFGMLSLLSAVVVARRSGFIIEMNSFNEWISDLGSRSTRTKFQNMENVRQFLAKVAR